MIYALYTTGTGPEQQEVMPGVGTACAHDYRNTADLLDHIQHSMERLRDGDFTQIFVAVMAEEEEEGDEDEGDEAIPTHDQRIQDAALAAMEPEGSA